MYVPIFDFDTRQVHCDVGIWNPHYTHLHSAHGNVNVCTRKEVPEDGLQLISTSAYVYCTSLPILCPFDLMTTKDRRLKSFIVYFESDFNTAFWPCFQEVEFDS